MNAENPQSISSSAPKFKFSSKAKTKEKNNDSDKNTMKEKDNFSIDELRQYYETFTQEYKCNRFDLKY